MPFGLVAVACTDKGVGEGPTCGDFSVTIVAVALASAEALVTAFCDVCDPPPQPARITDAISAMIVKNLAMSVSLERKRRS
jgi:hypothetical protein